MQVADRAARRELGQRLFGHEYEVAGEEAVQGAVHMLYASWIKALLRLYEGSF
jgi:hypothetical protein